MNLFFVLPFILLFASCAGEPEAEQETPPAATIAPELPAGKAEKADPATKPAKPETPEMRELKKMFISWQRKEIAAGRFWAKDSCRMDWFADHDVQKSSMPWGFPELREMTFSYADVNADGMTDQLVTFCPDQCDGGNASMWTKFAILTVSQNGKYSTRSMDIEGLYFPGGQDSSGFYHYDSIGVNKIYGTRYVFGENDGHCCPGITEPVVFDYRTEKRIK